MITHQLSMTTPDDPTYENQPQHWNQAHAQAFTILGNTAGASTISGTNIVLSAGPNATISVNGSTLVFSGGAGAAGNTGYLSDDAGVTASLGTIRFSNSNGIGWGINGQTLTASHNGLTSQSNQNVTAGNGGFAFQTLSFSNVNGMSFGTSAGSAITGSYTVPSTAGLISAVNVSAGTTSNNLSAVTFSNANGVSFGLNGSVVTGSVATSLTNINVSAGTTSNNLSAVTFSNANGVSFGLNGSVITGSVAVAGGAQTGISGIIVSDATYTSGTVSFSNQNGVTIGSSVNGASQYIRLSVDTSYLASNASSNYVHVSGSATTISGVTSANVVGTNSTRWAMEDHQHAGVYGAGVSNVGNTAGNTAAERPGRWILAGSNALTLSQETAAGSLQTIHIQGPLSATTISGVTSANVIGTRGSRFALEDHQHVGVYSVGVSGGNTAGDTAVRPGQVVFAGGANITLSMATAAGSLQTISIVGGGGGGGSQSVGMSTQTAGGATAGTTGYASGSAILYHFVPGSNITMSQSVNGASATMSIYAPSPGAAAENNWFNLLGANTAGNTTASGSTIGLSGINLTLSGTNGSAINISAPATSSLVGSSGISISTNGSTITVGQVVNSYLGNMEGEWVNSTTMQMFQSTSHIQPFMVEAPISFAFMRIPMSISNAASSTGVTTGNSSWSYGHSRSHNFVLYSRGVGASSLSLQSIASTQLTDQQSIRVSAAAGNSTQFSYTNRATYQMSTGPVDFTHDYSSSAASLNFHTSGMTANTGLKMMEFPWATSLAPGQYWLMYGVSSSTVSQQNSGGTRLFQIMSNYGMSMPNLAFGTIGAATNSSVGPFFGLGSFTTAGGGTTASLPISAVTTSGSHNKMFFALARIA